MSHMISIFTNQSYFSAYFVGILYIVLATSITCLSKNDREKYKTFWISSTFALLGVSYFFDFINEIYFSKNILLVGSILQILSIYTLVEFLILNSEKSFAFKLTRFLQIPSFLISVSVLLTFKSLTTGYGSIYLSILYFITSLSIMKMLNKVPESQETRNNIYSIIPLVLSACMFIKSLPFLAPVLNNGIRTLSPIFFIVSFIHLFCLLALSLIIVTESVSPELKNEQLSSSKFSSYLVTPFLTILLIVTVNIFGEKFEHYVLNNEKEKITTAVNNSANIISNLINSKITFAKTASSIVAASPIIENFFINPDEHNKKELYKVLNTFFKNYPDGFCYLLDKSGIVIASSKNEDILLGRNFNFRPYFKDAISGKPGLLIAMGRSTHILGFYSSRPVVNSLNGEILGVCCVKKNLTDLKEQFKKYSPSMLIDDSSNIFFSDNENLFNKKFIPPINYADNSAIANDIDLQTNTKIFSFSLKKFIFKLTPISLPNWNVLTIRSTYPLVISRIYTAISFLILSFALIVFLVSQARGREALSRYKGSQARFRTIFELAPESILIISLNTFKIASANSSLKSLFSFSEDDDIIDTDFETLIFDDPECLENYIKIPNGKEIKHEQVFQKKNSEKFTAEVICTKILIENEDFLLLFLRDVSLQKETENNLKNAKRAAEEASALKSRFLANTSHELRTPMTAIIGLTEIVKSQIESEKLEEILSMIQDSAKSLLDMLNDVLNLSQIEAGKILPEPEAFNLRESVEKITQITKWKAEKKGISVNQVIGKDIPEILIGDFKKIRQILMNITENAVKYTTKGTVEISVNMQIDASAKPVLEFSVSDTGVGMSREQQQDLFKSFLQSDPYLIPDKKGKGLGLIVAKKIIDLLEGTMYVESSANRGTTMRFTIPTTVPSSKKSLEKVSIENIKLKRNGVPLEILIADDNAINLLLARFTIEQYEGSPHGVKDGLAVLSILERKKFDLILLDIQMPKLDGIATIDMIRNSKHAKYKNVPIIAISAFADNEEILKNTNINDFLQKPYSQQELITKIIKVLPYEIDRDISKNEPKIAHQKETIIKNHSIKLKQVDIKELELRVLKKPENIKRIQTIFTERSVTLINELERNSDNLEKLGVTIHSIKGLCGMLAAREAFNNSRRIEEYIKNKKAEDLKSLISLLKKQISEIAEDLLKITEYFDSIS